MNVLKPLIDKMSRKTFTEKEFLWESRKFYEKLGSNEKKIILSLTLNNE